MQQDETFNIILTISTDVASIKAKLNGVDDKVDGVCQRQDKQNGRLRAVEKFQWMLAGGIGLAGFLASSSLLIWVLSR